MPLLCLGACAGVESDIRRAEFKENVLDLVKGRDRGYASYAYVIEKSTTKPRGSGRYQYVAPVHISNFMVHRAVRGLGGTRMPNSDYMAGVVDRLLYVVAHDPIAAIRATACLQLGRVLLRIPLQGGETYDPDPRSDARIHEIAADLFKLNKDHLKGVKVTNAQVLERMKALAEQTPSRFLNARQVVSILARPPVARSASKLIRAESERIVPKLVRDSMLVALRDVACGDLETTGSDADPDAAVRVAAAKVLARVASPVARKAAAARLRARVDPKERDPDVRRQLVTYLGTVGDPRAFEACLRRLDDIDSGVRYVAQRALLQMTDARVRPTAAAWTAWRRKKAAWQPAVPAAPESG